MTAAPVKAPTRRAWAVTVHFLVAGRHWHEAGTSVEAGSVHTAVSRAIAKRRHALPKGTRIAEVRTFAKAIAIAVEES